MAEEVKTEAAATTAGDEVIAGMKAKIDATSSELEKLKAEDNKRKADEEDSKKKKKQAEKLEAGKAQEELDAMNEQLRAAQTELEALRTAQRKRIDALLEQAPTEQKEKLAKWGEKLSLSDYEDFVREHLQTGSTKSEGEPVRPKAPPVVTPAGTKKVPDGKRELQPETVRILEDSGYESSIQAGERLVNDEGKLGLPVKPFIAMLKRISGKGRQMTTSRADEIARS